MPSRDPSDISGNSERCFAFLFLLRHSVLGAPNVFASLSQLNSGVDAEGRELILLASTEEGLD